MTYQEFMQWAEENEELKAIIPKALARWINADDVMDRLHYIEIYPNEYTNVPFSHGCYQDKQGNWYYYTQIDERTSLTPNGHQYPEEECFEKLKNSVQYEIQQIQFRRRKEQERLENMSPEEKQERERKQQEQERERTIQELFRGENQGVAVVEHIIIDVEKIYQLMDDTDEGDSNYADAKNTYEKLYNKKTAIRFLKIYKYMNKLSHVIQKGNYRTEDLLILQKIGLIFAQMNAKEDKKLLATKQKKGKGAK